MVITFNINPTRHTVLEHDISQHKPSPQETLESIAGGYRDQSAWWVTMVDTGREIARVGAVIQLDALATLASVTHPELSVKIIRYGLTRKTYKDGRSVYDQFDLRAILPNATDEMVQAWKTLQ